VQKRIKERLFCAKIPHKERNSPTKDGVRANAQSKDKKPNAEQRHFGSSPT
jgi:hypothetical protein